MPGAVWFPGASLNYAEHALGGDDRAVAVVSRSQTRGGGQLTFSELRDQVARARAGLQRLGVTSGDRVAAYLPTITESVVAFLATASLGAVWSSCAPEFGTRSVVDRFAQITPKVLVAVDGYRYGRRLVDRRAERGVHPGLPADPGGHRGRPLPGPGRWSAGRGGLGDLLDEPAPLAFDAVAFDHPLYVLYSSGTTGLPKAIVHGHGGILLEHLKALGLHVDIGAGDRFAWYTTTGWMMWNFLVSGLLIGATIVLFDGDPAIPTCSPCGDWRKRPS